MDWVILAIFVAIVVSLAIVAIFACVVRYCRGSNYQTVEIVVGTGPGKPPNDYLQAVASPSRKRLREPLREKETEIPVEDVLV